MTTYYDDGTIRVRSMEAEDAKIIYDTYMSYGWHPNIETYENYLKEQEAGERWVFIAEYEGAVKGICTLVLEPTEGPFGGKKIPEIVDLCVFFDIHGKGIGNKLMDVAEAQASLISDTVYLAVGVHSGYGNAQRIYVKRGYNFDGTGVWYQNKQLDQYAPCVNDDDLLLFMSKPLKRVDDKHKSLLETTLNTRDLGGYKVAGTENYTKFNRLIRSDAAIYPSARDIAFLKRIGVTTIIDTRVDEEIERKPHGLANVEGLKYYNFPITEGSSIPDSVDAVPGSYFACAHDSSIAKIFKTIAEADGAVMYNCSAGKDRTGVNTALMLWLCGVSKEDIVKDYMITKENNKERFKLIKVNFPDIDMNIVIPRESFMYDFMKLMEEAHGAVEAFFESIGIDAGTQEKLKKKLLGE